MNRAILQFIGRRIRRGIQHLAGFWNLWSVHEQQRLQSAALQERIDQLSETMSRFQTHASDLSPAVATEIDRLDGYLVYHAGALSEQIDELTSRLQAIHEDLSSIVETKINRLDNCLASRLDILSRQIGESNKLLYVQADLDALLI